MGHMAVLAALLPSLGVGVLFYFAIRAIVRADARERAEDSRLTAASRAVDER